jgi:hypothetical protein
VEENEWCMREEGEFRVMKVDIVERVNVDESARSELRRQFDGWKLKIES